MSRLFVSTPIDPRRLNQPAHLIARQTHGERRRIHGPIEPMEPEPPSWRIIALAALATAAIVAFTWLAIPALAERVAATL